MAITKIQPIVPSSEMGGFDIPQLVYNEANSSTYKTGALLTVSSGKMTEATSGTSGASQTTGVVGVALQAGQNLASAPVYPAYGVAYPAGLSVGQGSSSAGVANAVSPLIYVPSHQLVVFEGTLASNGADVAVATTDAFALYGLVKDSTSGFWYVDKNSTGANAACMVIGVKNPQDVVFGTTTGARVFFVFINSATQWK